MISTAPVPLVFLDTETTGLRPDIHVPWEVGWITAIYEPESNWLTVYERRSVLRRLSDSEIENADSHALQVGKFDERWRPAKAVSDVTLVGLLAGDLGFLRGATGSIPHLVGAVPNFDHAMLSQNVLGWPGFGEGLWHYHLVDVETLAAGKLGQAPPYSSDALCAAFNVTVSEEDKHTALGDAEWAMRLFRAVLQCHISEAGTEIDLDESELVPSDT